MNHKHEWEFDTRANQGECSCGSWINLECIGTFLESYAMSILDRDCREAYYEASKQHSNTTNRTREDR